MNKKGLETFAVRLIIVSIVIVVMAGAVLMLVSTMETASFATTCSLPAIQKSIYYSMPEAFRTGAPPILHQQCQTLTPTITTTKVNDTAEQLLIQAQSCWTLFNGKNLISDEGNIITCYLSSFTTNEYFDAYDLKFYMDNNAQNIKIVFAKETVSGDTAELMNMAPGAETIPQDFEAEILFSDWDTYSDEVGPTGVPYLRHETVWSYVDASARLSKAASIGQDTGIVNTFTEVQPWEFDILLLTTSTVLQDIALYFIGSLFDFDLFLDLVGNRATIMNSLFSDPDRPCPYYQTTSCGNLSSAMACCEDKVIICIK